VKRRSPLRSVPLVRAPRRRGLLVAAGAAVLAVGLGGCGSTSTALEVGDRSISRGDLTEQLEDWGLATQASNESGVDSRAAAQWSSWWVRFTALETWAADQGIEVTDDDRAAAEALIAESFPGIPVADNAALAKLVEWQALLNVLGRDEDLLTAALEANPQLALPVLCSRHILLDTEDDAEEVLELLDEGEDFADLAAERSTDPSAATNGGDLGCQPQGTFVPEFEEAAFAADAGDVVGPVETQFGFHVIEVLSVGEPTPDQVGPQLEQIVQGELIQGSSPLYADVFADQAVEVDARFGTWDASSFGVLSPAGPRPAPGADTAVPLLPGS
jgi:hypothetical protein